MLPRSLFAIVAAIMMMSFSTLTLADEGWIEKTSSNDVATTVAKLQAAVEKAGAKVFAVVDHAAGAASIGEEIPPATLVIFGNPKIGTPLIKANPLIGYDLPIRVLIWDDGGTTKIGFVAPAELASEYDIDAEKPVAMMSGAIDKLTSAAAAP